jgi:hypothetical protein
MFERFGCLWIALAVIGGLLLLGGLFPKPPAPELSRTEYEACIAEENAEFVRNCYRETFAEDLNKSRVELPAMPSPAERLRNCRANLSISKSIEKYYPDAQSACGKKSE